MPPRDIFEETPEQVMALFMEISNTSDRVAAISATAFLDDSLGAALQARFVRLGKDWEERIFSSQGAPLGTLSAKILMGYALGLFGPLTRRDLDVIRSIRNTFAHTSGPIFFTNRAISEKCGKLTSPERLYKGPSLSLPLDISKPRDRFVYAARQIAMELLLFIREKRPSYRLPPVRPKPPDALP